ncbi:hypothetical protein OkiPb00507_49950 [Escherichia coli]
MERFSWHVADKGFRMVRYYGFLSPVKRRLLEDVVYVITETVRKGSFAGGGGILR